jgi:hypothetical protein
MSSKEEPCNITGLALVTSVTEGTSNQEDWRVAVVADLVWEAERLSVWETKILLGDTGVSENNSLS